VNQSLDESPDSVLAGASTPTRSLQLSLSDASLDTKLLHLEEGASWDTSAEQPLEHPLVMRDPASATETEGCAQPPRQQQLPLTEPLSWSHMHVIAFAGMRGAVSFSLAYIFPDDNGNRLVVST
jgi:hypothetical protein